MEMVRLPCSSDPKMGLKKGPWTAEEDQILVSYIQRYGHENWRALPKQAGLMRCGKSCRLRWINYLRPDIKRGNFTSEEEEAIVKLHEMLGNRWSAIAAKLPGRTDNEIKNIWHTYLKKRALSSCSDNSGSCSTSQEKKRKKLKTSKTSKSTTATTSIASVPSTFSTTTTTTTDYQFSNSSTGTTADVSSHLTPEYYSSTGSDELQYFLDAPVIDESFWSEEHLTMEESAVANGTTMDLMDSKFMPLFSSFKQQKNGDNMDYFWMNVLLEA